MSMTIDFSGKTVLVTGADAEGYLLVNRIHGFGFCEGDYRTVFMHRRWSDIRKVKFNR